MNGFAPGRFRAPCASGYPFEPVPFTAPDRFRRSVCIRPKILQGKIHDSIEGLSLAVHSARQVPRVGKLPPTHLRHNHLSTQRSCSQRRPRTRPWERSATRSRSPDAGPPSRRRYIRSTLLYCGRRDQPMQENNERISGGASRRGRRPLNRQSNGPPKKCRTLLVARASRPCVSRASCPRSSLHRHPAPPNQQSSIINGDAFPE